MVVYRYYRWDNRQEVFPIGEGELMEQLSQQLMSYGDVDVALRAVTLQGVKGRSGHDIAGGQDFIQRLRAEKQRILDRYDLDHVLEELRQQIREIVSQERRGIERRLEDTRDRYQQRPEQGGLPRQVEEELLERLEQMAQRSREFLDKLSPASSEAIRQLQEYEFMDGEAKKKFDQLLNSVRSRVLNSLFKDVAKRLRSKGPKGMAKLKEMLRELNNLMEQDIGNKGPGFDRFMQKYGSLFGDQTPSSLEELCETLSRQMSEVNSLLKSLSPAVRRELEAAMDSKLGDDELKELIWQLRSNLSKAFPSQLAAMDFLFSGGEPLGLSEALGVVGQLQRMRELENQFRRFQQGSDVETISKDLVRELLGKGAHQQLETLRQMSAVLERAGYIRYKGSRLELTPKGMRLVGEKSLREIFTYTRKDRLGHHRLHSNGHGTEAGSETKLYEYGDLFYPHPQRSLMNAVSRSPDIPVKLEIKDFEVHRTEHLTQASTVLMIDLSLSMAMRGNFQAAKKVALALDNLIRTQFPRDTLYIVGFSTYAREVKPEQLAYLAWDEFEPYTNIQHGLSLASKLLSRDNGGNKQIMLISDGEPTAHLEGGQLFLQYPPSSRTIRETLKEVQRCTRMDITINTFMLERSNYLAWISQIDPSGDWRSCDYYEYSEY